MARSKRKRLSDDAIEMIAGRFRVLSEPTRLKILHTLGEGEMSVNELVDAVTGSQANVSKHLGLMFDAGLVARRREGVTIYYRIADETIFELCETACASLNERLAAQHRIVKSVVGT